MQTTIVGFPQYTILSNGVVKNKKGRSLKPYDNGLGYKKVNLSDGHGNVTKCYVHRLVAMHFIENPRNCSDVDHIDNNRSNNTIENLQWLTHRENLIKRYNDAIV